MMKPKPAVSVILPTYNRGYLLGRAIDSVLSQTFSDFELIIVDDGSTDNTEKVVKKYCDNRIRYIRHECNKGANVARNTGIRAARGDFFAFQDSDDEWMTQKLEEQMRVIVSAPPEVGVVYSGFWRVEGERRTYNPSARIRRKDGDIYEELLRENFVTTLAVLIKKECFERVGLFDESLPRFQDWEFFIRISKSFQFSFIDKPLFIAYFTPDSITANSEAFPTAYHYLLKKHMTGIADEEKIRAFHFFNIGHTFCLSGEVSRGRHFFIKALSLNPYILKYYCAYVVSLFGQTVYRRVVKWLAKRRGMD